MTLHVVDHPVLKQAVTRIRDKQTPPRDFRTLVTTAGLILGIEAMRGLPVAAHTVQTPLVETTGHQLARPLVLFPVLRAGLGLVEPFLQLAPDACVGHLGAYRDATTHLPTAYYVKLPKQLPGGDAIILDPMLATGGSANWALSVVAEQKPASLTFVTIVAAPEGIAAVQAAHPNVTIYTAALDERLNDNAYILPGLGDAGDRLYGTT